ncbi:hypothetical protein K7432_012140 [Basidiobolus ranarum]|uniref:Cyclin N-terminal domain-containing protein n=1 Tax=Basidiobolus ranarum TaxID=34480 RepID=A0ABR2VTA2_9FUNG
MYMFVCLEIAAKIVNCLFQCGRPKSKEPGEHDLPKLTDFIYRLLRRTNLSNNNLLTALIYLIRLKQRHPGCKGAYGSGHRLFLAALISANKYLHDDAYHNKSWAIVANGLFNLEEINQMESELLFYLNFKLVVTKDQWLDFLRLMEPKVLKCWNRNDYNGPDNYLFDSCTANIDGPLGNINDANNAAPVENHSSIASKRAKLSTTIENLDLALLSGGKARRTSIPSLPPVWELLSQKNSAKYA